MLAGKHNYLCIPCQLSGAGRPQEFPLINSKCPQKNIVGLPAPTRFLQ